MTNENNGATRRDVAKLAAWGAPVIVVGAPAPSVAASTSLTVTNHGLVSQSSTGAVTIDGTSASNQIEYGLRWTGVVSSIANVSLTFWFKVSSLTFTSGVSGWSTLRATGKTRSVSGAIYYAYTSNYSTAVTPTAGYGTTMLTYKFTASTSSSLSTFIAESASSVDGQSMTTSSGVTTLRATSALTARTKSAASQTQLTASMTLY